MMSKPRFVYILRRWDDAEQCQAQIVVIQSIRRLTWQQVRSRLECLTHFPAEEFQEVCQEPDTGMVLDTWDADIETMSPADMDFPAVKVYNDWWKEEVLTPVAVF